jgi:UDP-N-acetylmuramoyl-tripeptide--D-alanyl-D-alanine ligase
MLRLTLADVARVTSGRRIRGSDGMEVFGVSTDSRKVQKGSLFVALRGERFDGHDFVEQALASGASAALVERGGRFHPHGPGGLVEVAGTARALLALAADYRARLRAKVIGITGSTGKSTTKEMTAHVLSALGRVHKAPSSYNNVVGVSSTLLGAEAEDDYLVAEIGTNAPGEIALLARAVMPDAAVITNIGPTHLAALGSVEGVAQEKAAILDATAAAGVAVLPADDAFFEMLRLRSLARVVSFGFSEGADVRAEGLREEGSGTVFRLNGSEEVSLPLPGRHNVANALAAAAVALQFGLSTRDIAARLATVQPLPMRSRVVRLLDVVLIDDAYNANPSSFAAALAMLEAMRPRPAVVFAGDMLELGRQSQAAHRALGASVARLRPRLLVAVGAEMRLAAEAAASAGLPRESVMMLEDARSAAEAAPRVVRSGDAVLVKGSRRMGLEAVVAALTAALGVEKGGHTACFTS